MGTPFPLLKFPIPIVVNLRNDHCDDVIHPSWVGLVQPSNDGHMSVGSNTRPRDPAGRRDVTYTDGVSIQASVVKHTGDRGDSSKYTNGQATGEHRKGGNANSNAKSDSNAASRFTPISHQRRTDVEPNDELDDVSTHERSENK